MIVDVAPVEFKVKLPVLAKVNISFVPKAVDELMRKELSMALYPIVHALASGPNCIPASATAPEPTWSAPLNVEVAVVEAAVTVKAVRLPLKAPLPFTSRAFEGELVPMPTSVPLSKIKELLNVDPDHLGI